MIVCLNLDGVYTSKTLAVARKEKPDSGIWWGKAIKYFLQAMHERSLYKTIACLRKSIMINSNTQNTFYTVEKDI